MGRLHRRGRIKERSRPWRAAAHHETERMCYDHSSIFLLTCQHLRRY
nr:MAG TPA: hypothetical protein [Caudoviricetes sp.]